MIVGFLTYLIIKFKFLIIKSFIKETQFTIFNTKIIHRQ